MGAERDLTERLQRYFAAPRDARVGIGDDAAVVRNRAGESVVCIDPVVEGVHFATGADPRLVGQKAVHRNLSDLAAMGAVPDYLLCSLVLPRTFGAASLHKLLAGIRGAAEAARCFVVGGDVASATGPLVVTITAIGHAEGRVLVRDALAVGDALHVTGPLGGSIEGRHLRFRPRLPEGRWLARASVPVRAAIDVSDGLLLDLFTMLRASSGKGRRSGRRAGVHLRLGAELDAAAIPVAAAARRLSRGDRKAALARAFGDGEDHELLFAVQAGKTLPRGGPLTARARRPIGRVIAEPGLFLVDGGRRTRLSPVGHEHVLALR